MPERAAGDRVAVHLTALGVPLTLWASGDAVTDLVPTLELAWSRCLRSDGQEALVELDVVLDSAMPAVTHLHGLMACSSLPQLMHDLSPKITITAIEHQVANLLMFHAGAVSDPESGASVGLVGESGSGKTTAIRILARQFGYLSDETLGLRSDNTIVSYPKPLSILDGSDPVKQQVSPDELGLAAAHPEPRLVKLLVLDRDAKGPAEPDLVPIGNIEALLTLAPQTSSLSKVERPLHRIVDFLDATGGLHRVRYREAETLVPVVAELMGEQV